MLEFSVLGSGSNGNAFYFETQQAAFLIDAGLSYKKMKHRLDNMGKDIENISRVFITHEHIDHVYAIPQLVKRNSAIIHINRETHDALKTTIPEENLSLITTQPIMFNGTTIQPFEKSHDAANPLGFTVVHNNNRVPVITDLGHPNKTVINEVRRATALCLETNYDDHMLTNGKYPIYLKRRISSDHGHLSNDQASLLSLEHIPSTLKAVFLSHLSENNNTPEKALETFRSLISQRKDLNNLHIGVASRSDALAPFRL